MRPQPVPEDLLIFPRGRIALALLTLLALAAPPAHSAQGPTAAPERIEVVLDVSADMRDSSHAEVGYNPVFDKLDEPFILEEDSQGRPKVGVPIGSYDMTQWLAIWESDHGRPLAAVHRFGVTPRP